jgi:acyl-CoA synthetase (NDP forming)
MPQQQTTRDALTALIRPTTICVIGASGRRATRGNFAIQSLQRMRFPGRIIPVNPQAAEIEGLATVASIDALPPGVDVAFVAVPAGTVSSVIRQLDGAGVRSAIVITAGFSPEQDAELRAVAGAANILMHGPNCMGVLNFSDNVPLYSAGLSSKVTAGPVALLAQSGSAAIAVMNTLDIGFSKVMTVGSEFRVTASDYLDWLADDPATTVVGVILEAIQAPAAFAAAIRRVHAAGKAVVVLKVGRSSVGLLATQAHTGAMIAPSTAYDCFFRDLGVPIAADYDQFAAALTVLAVSPRPPSGTGVAIAGISGGETALMCDMAAETGVRLATWSPETAARVVAALPGTTGQNPVDVWASVGQEGTGAHLAALTALAADPAVGIIACLQDMQETLPETLVERYLEPVRAAVALRQAGTKPVVMISPTHDKLHPRLAAALSAGGVPALRGLWAGMGALRSLATAGDRVDANAMPPVAHALAPDQLAALKAEIRRHSGVLPGELCLRVLTCYGIPFVRSLTLGQNGVLPDGAAIDFPVVVKVASMDIAHRSDIGGVKLGVSEAGLADAIAAIHASVTQAKPNARIDGYEIQEQMIDCVEALAGFTAAPPFGVLTIVGTGGTLAELEADHASGLGPIDPDRAAAMIAGTRLGKVLDGYRNLIPKTDLAGLADLVCRLSTLAADLSDVLTECDLNPVMVRKGSGEVKVVDVLMVATRHHDHRALLTV